MSKRLLTGWLLATLTVVNASCSVSTPAPGSTYAMEELVLIEFAARLEEDYHRLHPAGRTSTPASSLPPTDVGAEAPPEPVQYDHGT